MNIDLSVKEYFEQLQLMEIQYRQEEAMYPWIYMLLQMVENKKKELLGESYKGISICDIHNAISGSDKIKNVQARKVKQFIDLKEAYPDFVIFDRNVHIQNKCSCFGCVEIKALGYNFIDHNNKVEFEVEKQIAYDYEMKFMRDEEGVKLYYCYGINQEQYNQLKDKEFKVVCIENDTIKVSFGNDEIEIEGVKRKECNGRHSNNTYVRQISKWSSKKPFDNETVREMMSHITSYKKVLYTNGLQFCLITLKGQDKYKVDEIANMKKYYEQYKENEKDGENAAILEWENLKRGLMSIDWYNDPIEI